MNLLKTFLFLFVFSSQVFAAYLCPMLCEGKKTYEKPGTCPVCHMNLTPEKDAEDESIKSLSSIEYRVEMTSEPKEVKTNQKVVLTFTPFLTKDGSILKKLIAENQNLIAVDLISQDLSRKESFFAESDKKGSFKLSTQFAVGGNYLAYVRLTPEGQRRQIFPLAIKVSGVEQKSPALTELSKDKSWIGTASVRLVTKPKPQLYKYGHLRFQFKRSEIAGLLANPSENLKMTIVSEDTTWYFEEEKPLTTEKGKTFVEFYVRPPKTGLYKIWLQVGKNRAEFHFVVKS